MRALLQCVYFSSSSSSSSSSNMGALSKSLGHAKPCGGELTRESKKKLKMIEQEHVSVLMLAAVWSWFSPHLSASWATLLLGRCTWWNHRSYQAWLTGNREEKQTNLWNTTKLYTGEEELTTSLDFWNQTFFLWWHGDEVFSFFSGRDRKIERGDWGKVFVCGCVHTVCAHQ